jgi:hypothetical protein
LQFNFRKLKENEPIIPLIYELQTILNRFARLEGGISFDNQGGVKENLNNAKPK